MVGTDEVWALIERNTGRRFRTITELEFTYEIKRSISRTNFDRALPSMPADRPIDIRDRQGAA